MTSVMLRHPYIRYRRDLTRPGLCLCTLCIVGIADGLLFHGSSSATWDLAGSLAVVASHAYAG